jgi:hypothetical protein
MRTYNQNFLTTIKLKLMSRQQKLKGNAKSTVVKTNLEMLRELAKAPLGTKITQIWTFYKANQVNIGLGNMMIDITEEMALNIIYSLENLQFSFSNYSEDEHPIWIKQVKYYLDDCKINQVQDPYFSINFFCYVWFLEDLGIISSDDYNGVVFVGEGTNKKYLIHHGKAA